MENHFKFNENVVIYGRRVGSGNPTKAHLINTNSSDQSSFCGFDSFTAEISIAKKDELFFTPNFCKRCLKYYNSSINH